MTVAEGAVPGPPPTAALPAAVGGQDDSGKGESVCVAIHVRPLVPAEQEEGCRECLCITPGAPQVSRRWLASMQR